jgi:hypothetical protein
MQNRSVVVSAEVILPLEECSICRKKGTVRDFNMCTTCCALSCDECYPVCQCYTKKAA